MKSVKAKVAARLMGHLKFIFCLTICSLTLGCASLASVSLTDIPANRSHPVSAEAIKWIFLSISFDNDFVYDLTSQLKKKCPGGLVTGVTTQHTVNSYPFLSRLYVEARGYCLAQREN